MQRKDIALLKSVKEFYNGLGNITLSNVRETANLRFSSFKDLKVVIEHLDKFPLITQKRADYELFKQALYIISKKDHLKPEGLQQIVNIKASLNLGLSPTLKAAFPNTKPVQRSEVMLQEIKDPHWLAGFTSGEGCFYVLNRKSKAIIGSTVTLCLQITQHSRDAKLIKGLISYLGCGLYSPDSKGEGVDFVVTRLSDITEKIIPFFTKYKIQGVKALDFTSFCKVAEIMKNKGHLTESGLDEIRLIKAKMNKGRIF